MRAWLDAFVEAFDLRRLIRCSTRVADLRPLVEAGPCAANGSCSNGAACTAAHLGGPRWSLTREDAEGSAVGGSACLDW